MTNRQISKQCIGIFHEEVLGGIIRFEKEKLSGHNIKANDNTLFADIKNKHNTMGKILLLLY